LVDALYACTKDVVLLFSARTVNVLANMVREAELVDKCRTIDALCLSPRIAEAARALPWRHIATPEQPTTEALLALLSAD
jgi:uroporphyrinogen-III synthase